MIIRILRGLKENIQSVSYPSGTVAYTTDSTELFVADENKKMRKVGTRLNIQKVSTNYMCTDDDELVLVNSSKQDITVYLPQPSLLNTGKNFYVKRVDATLFRKVTVKPANSTFTIDGKTEIDLSEDYETVHLVSDGSNWFILSNFEVDNGGLL